MRLTQFHEAALERLVISNIIAGCRASGGDISVEDLIDDERKRHHLEREEVAYVEMQMNIRNGYAPRV